MAIGDENEVMSGKTLSRDDLFLLMKSYENSVQQNTILLSQQQKLIEQQDAILTKQGTVCINVQSIVTKLASCGDNVNHVEDSLKNAINSFADVISHETQKVSTSLTGAIDQQTNRMVEDRSNCKAEHGNVVSNAMKDHNKINLRIYGAYAFLGGLIVALVTLATKAYEKNELIVKIAQYLGVI